MSKQTIVYQSRSGAPERFLIEEYPDHIEILRYCSEDLAEVEIPAEWNGKPVTVLCESSFFAHKEITGLVFPDTLREIGEQALGMCEYLHDLILPDSIRVIKARAFRDCCSLHKVILPADLEVLECGLFSFCRFADETAVKLPAHLKTICTNAFYGTYMSELTLPDSVEVIERGAFEYGPQVITKLPYDKGWHLGWPYHEKIRDAKGRTGLITDIAGIRSFCSILTVSFEDEDVRVYYPFMTDDYAFCDEKNQAAMQRELLMGQEEAAKLYAQWMNGYI